MSLLPGTRLGPYEVQAPLGAGGMGEVYRARDTRLGRDVAVKVLPQHLSSNPDLKMRFEREARTISALSHSHICHLYDIGSDGGTDYLVMELLEGESLAQRLQRGPLPISQALEYGIQISEALETAHRKGIVHRDLKPANVMLTQSGAKLTDFGLAKPVSGTAMSSGSALTLSNPLTDEHVIVGTYQYMAPEQIKGQETDARSDIFALGAVLYEMVTGRRAFEGKTQISVMSAILEKEPGPIDREQLVPPALEYLVAACLAKNRGERWQTAHDVKLQLKWIAASATRPVPGGLAARRRWSAWLATAAALALAILATYYAVRPGPGAPLMASLVSPPGVFADTLGRNGAPRISPDGSRLVFVGCRTESASASAAVSKSCSIWLQFLHARDAHEIVGTSGGYFPFWSPDGHEIAFFGDGKLMRVGVDGGPVQVICAAQDARGGSWGTSGVILFAATRGSPIYRVPVSGGTPVAITRSVPASNLAQIGSHRWPYFLPDGDHFLYVDTPNGSCSDQSEIHFASLDGKHDVPLMPTCGGAAYAAKRLIYWRDGNLVAQPFDPVRGALSGVASPIVEHVVLDSVFNSAEFSTSAEGTLIYLRGEGPGGATLTWYDRGGKVLGTLGEDAQYASVAISHDGQRVAADTNSLRISNIRVFDARGTRTLLTFGTGNSYFPTWSADDRTIYFTSNASGAYDILARAADGSGSEQAVVGFEKGQFGAALLAASPDGKFLAYVTSNPGTNLDIYLVPLTGNRTPQPLLHSPADEYAPAFSPDGRWLAYESSQSGSNEVYITPFPGVGAQYRVSTGGGERPVWRRDGKEIFYRENLKLMAVEVKMIGDKIELSAPQPLFEVSVRNQSGRWYDISPDGRFLVNTYPSTPPAQNFELIVDWPALLNK